MKEPLTDDEHAELYRICEAHSPRAYSLVRRLAMYGLVPDPEEAPEFDVGNRVIWNAGGNWGNVPATIMAISLTGKRVRIQCRPPGWTDHYDHRPYVTPAKLTHQTGAPQK